MGKTTLRIDGMSCDRCAAAVSAALMQLRGVSNTHVSFAERRATIEHGDNAPGRDQIIAAVEAEGYFAEAE